MADNSYTPFSLSPNPNSLYITDSLRAVIHKSKFTIDKRQGLTCVLGDVGLGKSTIIRYLQADYSSREDAITTLIPTPNFPSPFAMLKSISMDFKLEPERSFLKQQDALQQFLFQCYSEGKNVVIFIDEAQNIDNKQLELIRSLLNFESNTQKMAQIVLSGQLELKDRLSDKKNRAVTSRISTYSILSPLTLEETTELIAHRCKFENVENIFAEDAVETIYKLSGGVPREVFKKCALSYDTALLMGAELITAQIVEMVESETPLTSESKKKGRKK